MKEKAKSFGRSAALLAAIGIIAKLIGALYRVPLTNIVGAEGMGLYQMVFPLYTVLLAFCGGGVTSAVSRVVAKYTALGDDGTALRAVRVALIPPSVAAVVAVAAVAILRNVISGVQGNVDAGIAYLALCPSLLFAGGISALRGYFQGKSHMLPSGISQLAEQVIKLALGLYLAKTLLPHGVKYAVCGALVGVTASELVALAYLAIRFFVAKRKRTLYVSRMPALAETSAEFAVQSASPDSRALLKELYSFALPVTLGALVLPVTQMIDSVLVINLLMYGGVARAQATALFGLFVGPVGTLINMPTVVVLSVSIAFLPAITRAVERGEDAARLTKLAAKWIMLFVIPITLVFFVFPDRVCGALYRRGLTEEQLATAAHILRVQSIGVFYVGVLQLCTTVLQGHNRAHRPVINLVVGACVKVALTPLLVRMFGIIGAACATTACYAVAATLTARSAYKCMPIGASVKDGALVPVLFSVIAGGAAMLALWLMRGAGIPYLWESILAAGVFVAVYFGGVFSCGTLRISKLKKHVREKSANVK